MKPEEIRINIPEGYEIDLSNKNEKVLSLIYKEKSKKITEKITSLLDALDYLGESDEEVIFYRILLLHSTLSRNHHLVVYQALVIIIKALNEKWVPDWGNLSEVKYVPHFEMRGSFGFRFGDCDAWYSHSYVGSRLCFKSKELCEYACKQFIDIYRGFML